jgi:hypothetical protein
MACNAQNLSILLNKINLASWYKKMMDKMKKKCFSFLSIPEGTKMAKKPSHCIVPLTGEFKMIFLLIRPGTVA